MHKRSETTYKQAQHALRAAYRICSDGGDIIRAAEDLRTVMDYMRHVGNPKRGLAELVDRVDEADMSGTLTIIRRRGDGWRIDAVRTIGKHTNRFVCSGGGYATIDRAAERVLGQLNAKGGGDA